MTFPKISALTSNDMAEGQMPKEVLQAVLLKVILQLLEVVLQFIKASARTQVLKTLMAHG